MHGRALYSALSKSGNLGRRWARVKLWERLEGGGGASRLFSLCALLNDLISGRAPALACGFNSFKAGYLVLSCDSIPPDIPKTFNTQISSLRISLIYTV